MRPTRRCTPPNARGGTAFGWRAKPKMFRRRCRIIAAVRSTTRSTPITMPLECSSCLMTLPFDRTELVTQALFAAAQLVFNRAESSPHFSPANLLRAPIHSRGRRYAPSVVLDDQPDRLRQPQSHALPTRRLRALAAPGGEKCGLTVPTSGRTDYADCMGWLNWVRG